MKKAILTFKAWFKRRILHAPNQILILVDSNEYVRLICFKRRIVLPNKIANASDVFLIPIRANISYFYNFNSIRHM